MAKQAIIYTRFSPRPNADECRSNEKQEERCRAYCQQHGHEVVAVHADAAKTGRILDRPSLQAALAALKPGMVLVVDTSDRLARDMLVNLTIRHQVDRDGCALEFADGSPTHSTPEGELFQNILAAFAAYERARFARRTKAGLARKKARGEWLGKPPIGWQIDPNGSKQLIEYGPEQAAITRAREYASRGLPSGGIACRLTKEFGPCRGKPWSERTVRRILARS